MSYLKTSLIISSFLTLLLSPSVLLAGASQDNLATWNHVPQTPDYLELINNPPFLDTYDPRFEFIYNEISYYLSYLSNDNVTPYFFVDFSQNSREIFELIKEKTYLSSPFDIYRILSWRLQSLNQSHVTLAQFNTEKADKLFDILFTRQNISLEETNQELSSIGFQILGNKLVETTPLVLDQKNKELISSFQEPGLFVENPEINKIIQFIKENREDIKKKGAFVFDVDLTLLPRFSESIEEYQELFYFITSLLHDGIKIGIITANSETEQLPRIIEPLKRFMNTEITSTAKLNLFQNLTIYANGGSTKIHFNEDGDTIHDTNYIRNHSIEFSTELKRSVNQAILRLKKRAFGLKNPDLLKTLITESEKKPGMHLNWEKETDWFTPTEVKRNKKEKRKMSGPWIEMRGLSQTEEQTYVASLAVTPLSKFTSNGTSYDVRSLFISFLKEELEKNGIDPESLYIRNGGKTTVDISLKKSNKEVALTDFIVSKNLTPKFVFYHGDEMYNYDVFVNNSKVTQKGNDMSIVESEFLKKVHKFGVNRYEMRGFPFDKAIWIGRSPQAVCELHNLIYNQAFASPEKSYQALQDFAYRSA